MISIPPNDTRRLDYTLLDVREYPEYAAAVVPGSTLVPLATLERAAVSWPKSRPMLLLCRSGRRALQAAEKLDRMGFTNLAVLEGGIEAWQRHGLAIEQSSRKPWSLERQVRVVAGGIVVVTTVLGLAVSPWFFGMTLFVGSGLTIAGITDICLMATLLGKLPWNQPGRQKCG